MATSAARGRRRQKKPARTAKAKMRSYRERMRAAGMRQVQIWVPDTRLAWVRREARRQSLLASRSTAEKEIEPFLEAALADLSDEWKYEWK